MIDGGRKEKDRTQAQYPPKPNRKRENKSTDPFFRLSRVRIFDSRNRLLRQRSGKLRSRPLAESACNKLPAVKLGGALGALLKMLVDELFFCVAQQTACRQRQQITDFGMCIH